MSVSVGFVWDASVVRTLGEATDAAVVLGRRWAHGLIDSGKFDYGATYSETRVQGWNPEFGEDYVTDDDVRWIVLAALQRAESSYFTGHEDAYLDLAGLRDVLGINSERTARVLRSLEEEGLVQAPQTSAGWRLHDAASRTLVELNRTGLVTSLEELHSNRRFLAQLRGMARNPSSMYCVKCRTKREVRPGSIQVVAMKNGKIASVAVCSVCGTSMFKIGAKT